MLPGFSELIEHVVPFALVLARLAGLFVFAPVLGSVTIPARAKILFATAMTVAIYPVLPPERHVAPELDLFGLIPLLVFETLIGIAIGMISSLPIVAVQMGGNLMGYQMGLTLAQTYNPDQGASGDVVGQLAFFLATAVFLAIDGLEGMFIALIGTFEHLPPGGFRVDQGFTDWVTGLVSSGFEIALRVAAPVIGMTMIVLVGMGVIMKTMPQINVLTLGFALKILVGVVAFIAAMTVIAEVANEESGLVMRDLIQWGRELRPGAG
ncbi:MAG: flagellar biosynthetic protein FliR [Planctomycetota bacterium]